MLYETRLKFSVFNSPLPAGLSYKFRWPGALLAWPSKTHTLARSGGCCRLAFWPLPIENEGLQLILPFSSENMALYVPRPLHTVHSTITTWMKIFTLNSFTNTQKEIGRFSASQCGLWYLICKVWDQLLMLYYLQTRFFQGKACHLTWKKKPHKTTATHTHTYKARVSRAHQADVFWCVRLGGSRFEFIY